MPIDLHAKLIARQSDDELRRKAKKSACRSNIWTQEEIDHAKRKARRLSEWFECPIEFKQSDIEFMADQERHART